MKAKSILRTKMLEQRAVLLPKEKELFDQAICERLYQHIQERKAQTIHTFLPMGDEINIYPLIERILSEGRTVVTPEALPKRILRNWILLGLDQLQDGVYGTQFPANSSEYTGAYDLIIVPGLVFDKDHYRIGYGAGYYDAFLKDHPEALKVGIAYPFQIVEEVPREDHDVRLDLLIF